MLLIIPAIDILNGRSAYPIEGLEGPEVGTDPVRIARLLRTENAKTLHVTDLDGARTGSFTRLGLIRELVGEVDIPIEVSGGIATGEQAAEILAAGACRVVLHPGLLADDPVTAEKILSENGAGKVVVAVERSPGHPAAPAGADADPRSPVGIARTARRMGFRRILYTELDEAGTGHVLNTEMLRRIATESGLRVTVSGGITSFRDLQTVQELEPLGVDSIVLRKSLYENRFSCQKIWRMAESGNFPFTAKV